MLEIIKKTRNHLIAVAIFVGLSAIYFAPAVFEGKSIRQEDMIHAEGMGSSRTKQYEETRSA